LAAKHGWVGEDFVALKDRYAMHNISTPPSMAFADTPRRKPGWRR
jgi:hypothetical protein